MPANKTSMVQDLILKEFASFRKETVQLQEIRCESVFKLCQKPVTTKSGNKSKLFHHLKQKLQFKYEDHEKLYDADVTPTGRKQLPLTQKKFCLPTLEFHASTTD